MSIKSIHTGDSVRKITLSGGEWGDSPTPTLGDAIDCRIDINGANEDRSRDESNEIRSAEVFFAANPSLIVGDYLLWVSRSGVARNEIFRVVGTNEEGRPGGPIWLWHCDLIEDRALAIDIGELL